MSRTTPILLGLCHGHRAARRDGCHWEPPQGRRSDAATLKKHRIPRRRPHRGDRHRGVHARAIRGVAAGRRTFVVELRDVVAAGFEDDFTLTRATRSRPCGSRRAVRSTARRRAGPAHAQPADAAARAQRPQRDLRRGRSRRCRTDVAGGIDQPGRTGDGDPRRARRRSAAPRPRVTLLGTARLVATSIQEPKDGTRASCSICRMRRPRCRASPRSSRDRWIACASA